MITNFALFHPGNLSANTLSLTNNPAFSMRPDEGFQLTALLPPSSTHGRGLAGFSHRVSTRSNPMRSSVTIESTGMAAARARSLSSYTERLRDLSNRLTDGHTGEHGTLKKDLTSGTSALKIYGLAKLIRSDFHPLASTALGSIDLSDIEEFCQKNPEQAFAILYLLDRFAKAQQAGDVNNLKQQLIEQWSTQTGLSANIIATNVREFCSYSRQGYSEGIARLTEALSSQPYAFGFIISAAVVDGNMFAKALLKQMAQDDASPYQIKAKTVCKTFELV